MRSLECRFDSKVALVLVAAHPQGALKLIVTRTSANARNTQRVALPAAAMRIPLPFLKGTNDRERPMVRHEKHGVCRGDGPRADCVVKYERHNP